MTSALKHASYDALSRLPEHVVGEIVDGELVVSPRPSLEHGSAAIELAYDLSGPFHRGRGGPGGWRFVGEPELHLGADVLVPDLAGWRRERMPEPPRGPYLSLSPDWVCEILSPSSVRHDRLKKGTIYANNGVAHYWLLDPMARMLEVYRLQQGTWLQVGVFDDERPVHAEPFDAVALDLRVVFGGEPATGG